MSDKTINVLYVDDDQENLISFTATFRRENNINVITANSAKEAEKILDSRKHIHVLITDHRMPVKSGAQLIEDAIIKYPLPTRIIISAFIEDEAIIDAIKKELIFRAIAKPWDENSLKIIIKEAYGIYLDKILQKQRQSKLNLTDKLFNKIVAKKTKRK